MKAHLFKLDESCRYLQLTGGYGSQVKCGEHLKGIKDRSYSSKSVGVALSFAPQLNSAACQVDTTNNCQKNKNDETTGDNNDSNYGAIPAVCFVSFHVTCNLQLPLFFPGRHLLPNAEPEALNQY